MCKIVKIFSGKRKYLSSFLFLLSILLLSPSVIAKTSQSSGEYLAKIGDCVSCHTSKVGEKFSGGLPFETPLGMIYSTNITPDKLTGIGNYTYQDFDNAVRKGIRKDGSALYPAMPYPAFSKISDADMHELYTYFMHQVLPVPQANRENKISWPLSMRWPLKIWKWKFVSNHPENTDFQNDIIQRGAYLVQGLGHCGTCHTPRGIGFQEKAITDDQQYFLTGGTLEGWHAPNLTGNLALGLGKWSEQDIIDFLKTGRNDHTTAFGPMIDVINYSTQHLTSDDLKAIAVYLKSLPSSNEHINSVSDIKTAQIDKTMPGYPIYMKQCAGCHNLNGTGHEGAHPALKGNGALLSDDPSSVISVLLKGSPAPLTKGFYTGIEMPAFDHSLTDKQIRDVSNFIRNSWGNKGKIVTERQVRYIRKVYPSVQFHEKEVGLSK